MSRIMDYSFLFQGMSGTTKSTIPGHFQLSQLNSSSVQSQLKAAGVDTNSKQYKTVIKQMMSNANGAMYTNIQAIKNLMKNYDKDGDFIDPTTGLAGLDATNIPISQRHVIIDVDEKNRQEMFDNAKREFLQENGIANGDTTKRSDVFRNYQRSVGKADRLKGSWTLEQYERQYNKAFYDAAKAADPSWKPGKQIKAGALDGITREAIDTSLVKTNGQYGETFTRGLDIEV
jgi:hypothetical protein